MFLSNYINMQAVKREREGGQDRTRRNWHYLCALQSFFPSLFLSFDSVGFLFDIDILSFILYIYVCVQMKERKRK